LHSLVFCSPVIKLIRCSERTTINESRAPDFALNYELLMGADSDHIDSNKRIGRRFRFYKNGCLY